MEGGGGDAKKGEREEVKIKKEGVRGGRRERQRKYGGRDYKKVVRDS